MLRYHWYHRWASASSAGPACTTRLYAGSSSTAASAASTRGSVRATAARASSVAGVGDDPGTGGAFGACQVVGEPPAGGGPVVAGAPPPCDEGRRRLVERDDLAVRMAQRRAGGRTVVAERHDGRPPARQRPAPLAQHAEDLGRLVRAGLAQVPVVAWRLDDHLVVAGRRKHQPGICLAHAPVTVNVHCGDDRVLVGYHADPPVRYARRHPHPFRRRHVLVTRAERAHGTGAGAGGVVRPPGRPSSTSPTAISPWVSARNRDTQPTGVGYAARGTLTPHRVITLTRPT